MKSGREPSLGGQKKKPGHEDARLAGDRAVLHMVEKLTDPDPIVRERAALALGEMGDERAFSVLIDMARSTSESIPVRIIHALRNFSAPRCFAPLLQIYWEFPWGFDLAETIVACDRERAYEEFSRALSRRVEARRQLAVLGLGKIADRDLVPLFIGLLEDGDPIVRARAAEALGEWRDARAVPGLIARLDDRAAQVGAAATLALGRIGDPIAITTLLGRAAGSRGRREAAQALAKLDAQETVTRLLSIASDRTDTLARRKSAIASLGNMRDQRATATLIALFDDPTEKEAVRSLILCVIGEIGGEAAEERLLQEVSAVDTEYRVSAFLGLTYFRTERSARMIVSLIDAPDDVLPQFWLNEFFENFAQYGHQDGAWPAGPFIDVLRDGGLKARRWAALALMAIQSPDAEAAITGVVFPAIDNPDSEFRAEVIANLWRRNSEETLQMLLHSLNSDDRRARLAAIDSLANIHSPQAIGPLIAVTDDPDVEIRYRALTSLGAMNAMDAIPIFIRHLSDSESLPEDTGFERICDAVAELLEWFDVPEATDAVRAWRRAEST